MWLCTEITKNSVNIDSKIDKYHQETIRQLDDINKVLETRPTFEFVSQSTTSLFQKFEDEMTAKFDKKLKELDYREQITKLLQQESEDNTLSNQVSYCLGEIQKLKQANDTSEMNNKLLEQKLADLQKEFNRRFETTQKCKPMQSLIVEN